MTNGIQRGKLDTYGSQIFHFGQPRTSFYQMCFQCGDAFLRTEVKGQSDLTIKDLVYFAAYQSVNSSKPASATDCCHFDPDDQFG